jgi:hypothetical protein
MAIGIRCPDYVTPLYPQKLALISPTQGGRSLGRYSSLTDSGHGVYFFVDTQGCMSLSVGMGNE